jgi:hypothetical protein
MLSSKQPSYTTISELDRKVREFTIPEAADALVTGTGPIIPDESMTRVQRLHLSILSHVRETSSYKFGLCIIITHQRL